MKSQDGRRRVVIEEVQPQVDGGRYPAKRILGDNVRVTAAVFGDGHDHIGARLLFRSASKEEWQFTNFKPLSNDLWVATFPVDAIGTWTFTIEAWIDHFDTWAHDLVKRLAAQSGQPQLGATQDIPLALRIGASHLEVAASRAKGSDSQILIDAATTFRGLADDRLSFYESPISGDLIALAAKYPDMALATRYPVELPLWVDRERARFSSWYELFPRSTSDERDKHGTLLNVEARLPEIAEMGFDILYMPPIHPIGNAFRKGKNNSVVAEAGDVGSPWAIGAKEGGHTTILPELGTLDDFASLVSSARAQNMEIAMDIAFQCSPDHPWVAEHPSWFIRRPDGSIQYAENPPKKYQDIYPLNFESPDWFELWDALFGVFEFWVERGVRVFRVDNPHTKALPFWEWCIAQIQKDAPDVIFLAEAFTRPHVMYSLAKAGFTQGYTYFTWRTTKPELQAYFEELFTPPVIDFFRPNVWPNTPDILHEQLQNPNPVLRRAIFQQRVILAATLSSNYGIYGPAYELCEGRAAEPAPGKVGSEEYLNSEKYQLRTWNRNDPMSIAPLIRDLNRFRHENPALQRNDSLLFHECPNSNLLCYSKSTDDLANVILVAVNLDPANEQTTTINLNMPGLGLPWTGKFVVEDMLTGTRYEWRDQWNYVAINPALPAHIFRIIGPQA
jgi:starch synthase (maltosyl-transferring)